MNYAVVFTTNDAVIIKRVKAGQKINSLFNLAMGPSLEEVKQVPTKYWKLKSNRVVSMNTVEKTARDLHIRLFGPDHSLKRRFRFRINLVGKLLGLAQSTSLLLLGAIGGYLVRSSNI